MIPITFKNNYAVFIEDFGKDTGLDAKKEPAIYIAYYNARFTDQNYQLNFQLGELILQKIESLNR